jgi:hypothetical protein
VIGVPPFDDGGVKLTVAVPLPAVAVTAVGASGTALGVTTGDDADGWPGPAAFVALTVNEYGVPFVSPVTVIGLPEPVALAPPGDAVTV